jgi:hypothetical protein
VIDFETDDVLAARLRGAMQKIRTLDAAFADLRCELDHVARILDPDATADGGETMFDEAGS